MSGAGQSFGLNPLAILAPNLYAKQIGIQRRQALGQALLEQGGGSGGNAAFGGLRNAGNAIMGAMLLKNADKDMVGLYTGDGAVPPGQDTGQVTNTSRPTGVPVNQPTQPQASGASPQALGNALVGNQGQPSAPSQSAPVIQQSQSAGQPPMQVPPQEQPTAQPQTYSQAFSGIMPMDVPGRSHQQSMYEFLLSPDNYWKDIAPTPEFRNALSAANGDPMRARQFMADQLTKAGTIDLRDQGSAWIPDGKGGYRVAYGPNENLNEQFVQGPDGRMIALPIQQGAEVAAAQAGAVEQAKEQNKIVMVKLADGREVPMYAGPAAQNAPPPTGGPQPMPSPAGTPQPMPAPAAIPHPTIGQSDAEKKIQEAKGESAANLAKSQAATEATLKAIDGLIAINDKVPDSAGIPADWKAAINKRAPNLPVYSGDAGSLQQWEQLNGIGVLGGLKALQGLGRLDLPEVNQVIKTNGIPADLPRGQRLQILKNLRTMVQNNLAAAQGNVANLNNPNLANPSPAPMQNYGQQPQQQARPMPAPPVAQRKAGQFYMTPRGPLQWNGHGWLVQ